MRTLPQFIYNYKTHCLSLLTDGYELPLYGLLYHYLINKVQESLEEYIWTE